MTCCKTQNCLEKSKLVGILAEFKYNLCNGAGKVPVDIIVQLHEWLATSEIHFKGYCSHNHLHLRSSTGNRGYRTIYFGGIINQTPQHMKFNLQPQK